MKKNIEIFNYKEMYRVHTIEDKDKNKELGDIISRSYFALYKFYDDNDLSLTKLTDNGKILHDPVFENDLTLAGLKFRYVVRHWFGLKSSSKNLPDIRYLEKSSKKCVRASSSCIFFLLSKF